jgi:hypothetical protein
MREEEQGWSKPRVEVHVRGAALERWVQDWVQVAALKVGPQARKSRRVNDSVDGYEPGGRRFESCWAHHVSLKNRSPCSVTSQPNESHVT